MRFLPVAICVAIVVAIGFLIDGHYADNLNSARADAKAARGIANAAVAASVIADEAADSAKARAGRAEARADSLARRAVITEVEYRTLAIVAPDSRRPALEAADRVIALQKGVIATQRVVIDELAFALDTTESALSELRVAAIGLSNATAGLEKASKPSLLRRLLPRPGIGNTTGIDARGRLNNVTGLTFGWSF